MTKPFALQELAARLEVLARRGKGPQSRVLKVADLTFNLDTLTVNREGKSIQLNPIGLKLLQALMEASTSVRSEEHTSELQSLMRISYAVFFLKKKKKKKNKKQSNAQK